MQSLKTCIPIKTVHKKESLDLVVSSPLFKKGRKAEKSE